MHPAVLAVTGVLGTLLVVRFIRRECKRVDRAFHKSQPVRQEAVNLRRDPRSGVYRPE